MLMVVFVAVSGSFLVLRNQKPEPQNLGAQLEYVGRDDLGCFLWWCEVKPYSVYYFATDLGLDELKGYFPKAYFLSEPEGGAVLAQITPQRE